MHKKRQLGIIAVIPLLLFGIFYGLKHGYISPMVKGIDIRIIGGTFITNVNKYVIKLGDTVSISPGEYIMVPDFAKRPSLNLSRQRRLKFHLSKTKILFVPFSLVAT